MALPPLHPIQSHPIRVAPVNQASPPQVQELLALPALSLGIPSLYTLQQISVHLGGVSLPP